MLGFIRDSVLLLWIVFVVSSVPRANARDCSSDLASREGIKLKIGGETPLSMFPLNQRMTYPYFGTSTFRYGFKIKVPLEHPKTAYTEFPIIYKGQKCSIHANDNSWKATYNPTEKYYLRHVTSFFRVGVESVHLSLWGPHLPFTLSIVCNDESMTLEDIAADLRVVEFFGR